MFHWHCIISTVGWIVWCSVFHRKISGPNTYMVLECCCFVPSRTHNIHKHCIIASASSSWMQYPLYKWSTQTHISRFERLRAMKLDINASAAFSPQDLSMFLRIVISALVYIANRFFISKCTYWELWDVKKGE